MGVCCVKQTKQDQDEANEMDSGNLLSLLKTSEEGMKKIKQIQRTYRRYRADKQAQAVMAEKPQQDIEVIEEAQVEPITVNNPHVIQQEAKLGPFMGEMKLDDNVQREKRATVALENGAQYTGEW